MTRTTDYQHRSDWLDHHLWPQINTMMVHDAVFKLLGYVRKLTGGFNGPIGWLMDVEYLVYQMTAIRRQCDPRRNVISLRRLLNEAKLTGFAPKHQIIDELSQKLDRCRRVCDLVNNYIAHTADPLRRPDLRQWDLQVVHLTEAQKAVCGVAVILDRDLLQRKTPGAILPILQREDIVQEFRSWVPEDDIQRLFEFWHAHRRTVNAWCHQT
jgi:hypothetical protein